ncbi:von Willebrand factor D and EGF domain-containing -like [Brachionus plicatilis]|uniref:von Willebrand factor D and EGF domain-containing-like n=1 Tax=Brachionus plicatilis TaxID=10195 RepID=A0A3M7RKE1_BRAPC|nr:von Willebrand factor D and EGF domain-containing -like [Brachionus plicatilis]
MIKVLLFFYIINFAKANLECFSHDDPHMKTFDGMLYEFQYPGDQFILYDDFSGTRVTASYQSCNYNKAFCNCAFYFKKGNRLVFVDFCSNSEPLSKLIYGVSVDNDSIGVHGIKEMPPCQTISPLQENNESAWRNVTTFMDTFKCARIQGSNYYDTYVIRTVERYFSESVKVKFQINKLSMPTLKISPSQSSYQNTGGICGMWDNNKNQELYVLDKNGIIQFTSDVTLARDFWKLHSRYNKDVKIEKRCPECNLMAERAIYCPCDEFDMFDTTNYNIEYPNRTTYCKVPMFDCIKKYLSIFLGLPFQHKKITIQHNFKTLSTK